MRPDSLSDDFHHGAMRVVYEPESLKTLGHPVCAAIGMFDGVHLGHQQVLQRAISDAEEHEAISIAVTFDRHPNTVVAPARSPPLIYSLSQKLHAIEAQGVDVTLLLEFDRALSLMTSERFIEFLAEGVGKLRSLSVGSGFRFGHQGRGDVPLLQSLGRDFHFSVHSLPTVSLDGEPVSSTRIRRAIQAEEFDLASEMLGRPYKLAGRIVEGDKVGRELGFPTANLDTSGLALPSNGIYAAHAEIDNTAYRAVINIGYRPTLHHPGDRPLVEAYLLGFSGNLYGKQMGIHFIKKLRMEQKFGSLEALKAQIEADVEHAKRVFT